MKIIGISGWKRSGKDTVGNILTGNGYMRTAFADALKKNVRDAYGLTVEQCEDQSLKETPLLQYPAFVGDKGSESVCSAFMRELKTEHGLKMGKYDIFWVDSENGVAYLHDQKLYWTPRALMIMEGTSKRAVNPNYWVDQVVSKIEAMSGDFKNFYVSDLRYISEAEALKKHFGSSFVTLRVNRFDTTDATDASERDLDNYGFDYCIENKGTLDELNQKVNALVEHLHGY